MVGTLDNSPKHNLLAINSLIQLPLELFSKKTRKLIMESWALDSANSDSQDRGIAARERGLNHAILGLNIKVMQHPTTYEVCIKSSAPFIDSVDSR